MPMSAPERASSAPTPPTPFAPLREVPPDKPQWKKGDVLVVFGELFARGYANGLVDEALAAGMTVVRSTVGRRDADGKLRALRSEEAALQPKPFINIPLEAGFDLEPAPSTGRAPVDQLQGTKMGDWAQAKLDFNEIEESRVAGSRRFKAACEEYMRALEEHIPPGANVLFAHTMAGGVPRAKIYMPTMNRIFKGVGERHASSETFHHSDMGRLALMSFDEVTANTFQTLIETSAQLRSRIEKQGGVASYLAYGYHGTEILIDGKYAWQTYTPYFQGWAKMRLERFAEQASERGIKACVFNCPEILTNSSSIFLGVEVSLYPLLGALKKEGSASARAQATLESCLALLKEGIGVKEILRETDSYMNSKIMKEFNAYPPWPLHNRQDEMENMLAESAKLIAMHRDEKKLITYVLSEEVFQATGYIMLREAWQPKAPVLWLGHDVLAKVLSMAKT